MQMPSTAWTRWCGRYRLQDSGGEQVVLLGRFRSPLPGPQTDDLEVVVQDGDRLDLIAARLYGSPSFWWVLAERNGIDLPGMMPPAGQTIWAPNPQRVGQLG